jgi:hypothetical protein
MLHLVGPVAANVRCHVLSRRKQRLTLRIGAFLREYERKGRGRSGDPNDRHYDRDLEKEILRMDPAELGALLAGDFEEELTRDELLRRIRGES